MASRYEDGSYASRHPDWHAEDSPLKARWLFELAEQVLLPSLVRPHIKLLDFGCGAGGVGVHFAKLLEGRGIATDLTGIDVSPQAINMARAKWLGVRFEVGDRPDDIDFDLALFIDVLEHLDRPGEALSAARKYTARIAVQLPLEDNLLQRLRPGLSFYTDVYGHLHFFHRSKAHELLEGQGWRIIGWRWTGGIVDPRAAGRVTLGTHVRRCVGRFSWDLCFRLFGQAAWMAIAERHDARGAHVRAL